MSDARSSEHVEPLPPADIGSNGRCPRCHEFKVIAIKCYCQPFGCAINWNGTVGDDAYETVYAVDAEAAAEKFAEDDDGNSGEYTIARNGHGEVWTRDGAGLVQRWMVQAEQVVHYHARAKR